MLDFLSWNSVFFSEFLKIVFCSLCFMSFLLFSHWEYVFSPSLCFLLRVFFCFSSRFPFWGCFWFLSLLQLSEMSQVLNACAYCSVNELTTDCQLLSQGCKPACQNLSWGESYRKYLVDLRLNFPFPVWCWKCFPTCSSVSLPFFSDTWSHQFLSLSIVFQCEVFATYWAPSAGRLLAEFSVFLVCSVNWTIKIGCLFTFC